MTDKAHKHATIAFNAKHPDALAIYCSDGRFTDAVEALVHQLGHARLDVLCMPGGPALLDLESASFSALETMRTGASFLIRGHGTKHVVLVAHEGCGYYKERYRFESAEGIVRQQREDLRKAAQWLLGTHPDLKVSLYFAKPEGGKVAFESEG
jgi:carbonic anhydrase